MIIDAFTFYNEFDILEKRFQYLYNTVDVHILVEANITFNGNPKPWNFLENRDRFKYWADRIVYFPIVIDSTNIDFEKTKTLDKTDYSTVQWQTEYTQRRHITKSLSAFDDDDIIIVSDVDEFPSKSGISIAVQAIKEKFSPFMSLEQLMFYYNFKQRQTDPWSGPVLSTVKSAREQDAQWIRDMRFNVPKVFNGGWHCSYFGGVEMIQNKIRNFSHSELNNDKFTDSSHIKQRIDAGLDLFDRKNEFVPFDPVKELPEDFLSLWPESFWK
jgi:beta-1,4-mannosyl-glycoprotein beta-1,4-N-acetylglucosaminyltransferase